jgi:polygalacturonase
VYSRNIVVQGVTILAPTRSPNTDDINPDLCSHICVEYCYVVSSDDCVAIKSGRDEYSIAYGMPSEHIVVRRLTCVSPTSAAIALGSEMSGGIRDVRVEDITVVNSESRRQSGDGGPCPCGRGTDGKRKRRMKFF